MPGDPLLHREEAHVSSLAGKPRDPARIPRILAKVAKIWAACPDWRLGQLLGNMPIVMADPYYIEDHELESAIDMELERRKL